MKRREYVQYLDNEIGIFWVTPPQKKRDYLVAATIGITSHFYTCVDELHDPSQLVLV
jgi:hypothetical protein